MPVSDPTISNFCRRLLACSVLAFATACATVGPVRSQAVAAPELPAASAPTYADLVTMAVAADTVAIVTVDDQIPFPPERAPDVGPSSVRLYIEALTQTLLAAPTGIGEEVVFVVDQRRDPDGDPPDLEERSFVLFGDLSRTQPGAIQLLSSRAMLPAGPQLEARIRRVLSQIAASGRPAQVTGVRDVISVPGNLAGESETQMFVQTADGAPVSLTVIRRPGMAPEWGASLGELVDASARPPQPETLEWYRFACFLPRDLAPDSFLQRDRESQAQARADYAFVLQQLGPCERRFT